MSAPARGGGGPSAGHAGTRPTATAPGAGGEAKRSGLVTRAAPSVPRVPEVLALLVVYGFLAYAVLGVIVQRFLPSGDTEPWPTATALYALVLIHAPAATGVLVHMAVHRRRLGVRVLAHLGAVLVLMALFLGGVLV